MIYKTQGESNAAIAQRIDVNVNTVKLCLKKFKEGGVDLALYDRPRPGHPIEITDDAVAWIVDLACQRPADLGYSQELWTLKNLHQHIQKNAQEVGFPRLATITKPMVQKILRKSEIKPFKIKYYCEKRDPEFEQKMHDVLLVYKQISLQFNEDGSIIVPEDGIVVHTVSCDEKPGIQAIATTGDDLRPTADTGCVYRDAEYKRLGTLSLLAGIDLLTEPCLSYLRRKLFQHPCTIHAGKPPGISRTACFSSSLCNCPNSPHTSTNLCFAYSCHASLQPVFPCIPG